MSRASRPMVWWRCPLSYELTNKVHARCKPECFVQKHADHKCAISDLKDSRRKMGPHVFFSDCTISSQGGSQATGTGSLLTSNVPAISCRQREPHVASSPSEHNCDLSPPLADVLVSN